MTPEPTPTVASHPPPPIRRLIVALLVAVPWMLALFQLVVVVPRYHKMFREYGLKLPDLTQACVDVGMWVQGHLSIAFGLVGCCIVGSMLTAYRVYGKVGGRWRWWVLFTLYAVPTATFLVVLLAVTGPHAKLEEGLRK